MTKPKVVDPKKHIFVKRKVVEAPNGPSPEVVSTTFELMGHSAKEICTPSKHRKIQKDEKVLTREERIQALKPRMCELVEYVKCQ